MSKHEEVVPGFMPVGKDDFKGYSKFRSGQNKIKSTFCWQWKTASTRNGRGVTSAELLLPPEALILLSGRETTAAISPKSLSLSLKGSGWAHCGVVGYTVTNYPKLVQSMGAKPREPQPLLVHHNGCVCDKDHEGCECEPACVLLNAPDLHGCLDDKNHFQAHNLPFRPPTESEIKIQERLLTRFRGLRSTHLNMHETQGKRRGVSGSSIPLGVMEDGAMIMNVEALLAVESYQDQEDVDFTVKRRKDNTEQVWVAEDKRAALRAEAEELLLGPGSNLGTGILVTLYPSSPPRGGVDVCFEVRVKMHPYLSMNECCEKYNISHGHFKKMDPTYDEQSSSSDEDGDAGTTKVPKEEYFESDSESDDDKKPQRVKEHLRR